SATRSQIKVIIVKVLPQAGSLHPHSRLGDYSLPGGRVRGKRRLSQECVICVTWPKRRPRAPSTESKPLVQSPGYSGYVCNGSRLHFFPPIFLTEVGSNLNCWFEHGHSASAAEPFAGKGS